ncbi:hypothetical protein BC628DRAFT_1014826 [Trametes gibbosa]|nr:hypothetical protein BC628DRAFT_1014826 [Trametes gibbosa]
MAQQARARCSPSDIFVRRETWWRVVRPAPEPRSWRMRLRDGSWQQRYGRRACRAHASASASRGVWLRTATSTEATSAGLSISSEAVAVASTSRPSAAAGENRTQKPAPPSLILSAFSPRGCLRRGGRASFSSARPPLAHRYEWMTTRACASFLPPRSPPTPTTATATTPSSHQARRAAAATARPEQTPRVSRRDRRGRKVTRGANAIRIWSAAFLFGPKCRHSLGTAGGRDGNPGCDVCAFWRVFRSLPHSAEQGGTARRRDVARQTRPPAEGTLHRAMWDASRR